MPPRTQTIVELLLPTTTKFTKIQQFLARAFALSLDHNPRNIEHSWYGFWNHVLLDMVKDTRNLIVHPQYVVWATPEDMDVVNDGIPEPLTREGPQTRLKTRLESVLKDIRASSGGRAKVVGAAQPSGSVIGAPTATHSITENISATSTLSSSTSAGSVGTITLPPNSSTRIADFAILQFYEGQDPADDPTYSGDVSATSVEVKIIVEIKRFVSRGIKGDILKHHVDAAIQVAIKDALVQAALLFTKFEGLNSVVAIAASGDYWRHTTLSRENIDPETWELLSLDTEYKNNHVPADWTPAYPLLDGKPSMKRLRKLFDDIRA